MELEDGVEERALPEDWTGAGITAEEETRAGCEGADDDCCGIRTEDDWVRGDGELSC